MPTVMRIGPYRFPFYSREGNEPPHIHVAREDMESKFWLRPVALAANHGFARTELFRIEKLVEEHCQTLINAYIVSAMETKETVAVRCWVEDRRVWLELADQRLVSFPASKYPLLAKASQRLLEKVTLGVQGLALRWEELDEDIWVEDAVCGRFPHALLLVT